MISSRNGLIAGMLLAGAFALPVWAEELALVNPGFEQNTEGWRASGEDTKNNLSSAQAEAAHSGQLGLRVEQGDGGPGSWMESSKLEVQPGKSYRLSFWARSHNQSGAGVWLIFKDESGKKIDVPAEQGAKQITQGAGAWTEYTMDFTPPQGAASVTFAVHCYSQRPCLADFDDFSVSAN
ncbi:MAG: carbohydrate binding domain-containing protein [Verrucomicrobia bacterium]|nr:carbohydrate binding domain-containing protein [Verrucomicrobiota bacterium]